LVHFNPTKRLYIDLDASKAFGFGAVLYHVKDESASGEGYPKRSQIEPIMFLSRMLGTAERNYWPTELEIAGIVWVLRKCRHMIESCQLTTRVYTDHGSALGISRQKTLSTVSAERSNLRLVRASEYIQRFNIELRHKPGKTHIVPNALSRLAQKGPTTSIFTDSPELDFEHAYFTNGVESAYNYTTTIAEFSPEFKTRLQEGYLKDPAYVRVKSVILENGTLKPENQAKLPFITDNQGLIWHVGAEEGSHRLCIPETMIGEML
jgi:hypothetical protein